MAQINSYSAGDGRGRQGTTWGPVYSPNMPTNTPTAPIAAAPVQEDVPMGGGAPGYGAIGLDADFGEVPEFTYKEFVAPTVDDAMREPGYDFRLRAGQDALQKTAAAKGALRTSGTLKDLSAWSQNFASSEYNNVYDRALKSYGAYYTGRKDAFAPKLMQWQNNSQWARQRALAMFNQQMSAQSGNNANHYANLNAALGGTS